MYHEVTALGELLIDFTSSGISGQGNPLFEANPGGAPCNVLAMLAKLEQSTAFIGKVGDDLFGRLLKKTVEEAGIDTAGLVLDPNAHTTLAFVQNAPDGDRAFSFYRDPGADELLTAAELPDLTNTHIFHFGSLSLTREPVRTATRTAVARAKDAGSIISFDPNLRESLWKSLDEAKEQMLWGCEQCDILKVAEEELSFLTGIDTIGGGAAALREKFPNIRLLLVTRGAKGSEAFLDAFHVSHPGYSVHAVDTTGAGDTFCAACLFYALEPGLDALDEAGLSAMLSFANAAAALVTTRKGAIRSMPTTEEIRQLMEGRK